MRTRSFIALLALSAAPAIAQYQDLRSLELLDYDCVSEINSRRVTLFGNGTARLKLVTAGEPSMLLKELAPDELDGYLNRFREIDLSETESVGHSASGDWVARCTLELDLPAEGEEVPPARVTFSFAQFDSLSLALSRVVGIADEIANWVQEQAITADFPYGYEPSPGDVLRRKDGVLFEVIAFTSDLNGVEMWGVEQPLVIYVQLSEVVGEFVEIVETRSSD